MSDVLVLAAVIIGLYYFIDFARQGGAAFHAETPISLSLMALPKYSIYSLIRAAIAYLMSLGFTLVYGYFAAKSRSAERVMLPLLDIGQSIPVLGFMPGLVLGLIAIFPHSNFGMELACILLIFTGQVWNMTFSFYASIKAVPTDLYEMGNVIGLSWVKKFIKIELPYSAIGLAWNSLMSMAGGWFFLTTCESFNLGDRPFRLPGLGSYMALAIEKNDTRAQIAAVVAMCLVILFADFVIWRPIIAWTRKFRLEDLQEEVADIPFVTMLLRESTLVPRALEFFRFFRRFFQRPGRMRSIKPSPLVRAMNVKLPVSVGTGARGRKRRRLQIKDVLPKLGTGAAIVIVFWGFTRLWELVRPLQGHDWMLILRGTGYTLVRVVLALVMASIWAVPFGIWVGRSPRLTRVFQPIVQLAASFPAPMLYPLVMGLFIRFGMGLPIGSTFLMLLGVQWYVLFNVLAGAISISKELKDSMDLIQVGRSALWKKLYLPSVFPALVTGWITAAGGAWNASIVAEYVKYGNKTIVAPGLGSLISEATAAGNYPLLGGCLMVMVATVVGINRTLWRRVQKFAETRYRFER